jgi:hypothetical protein
LLAECLQQFLVLVFDRSQVRFSGFQLGFLGIDQGLGS